MPMFIDCHPIRDVRSAVQHQLHLEALHGVQDPNGTKPLGHWLEDGALICLLEAPDEQAVCRHHADRGLPCDDLHLISGLTTTWPPTPEDEAILRAEILRLWH